MDGSSAAPVLVCLACGKVKGEHRGWDVSCDLNSRECDPRLLVRETPGGRVKEIRDPTRGPVAPVEFPMSEGSANYVLGARPSPEHAVLTVAKVLEEQDDMALFGRAEQSDSFDELETLAIESNPDFHRMIIERIRDDRTVHAVTYKGAEIVRYARAGKWFIEWPKWFIEWPHGGSLIPAKHVGVGEAARTAVEHSGDIRLGLPGGKVFDAKVRRLRGF